jgi:hypothetical protein
MVGSGDVLDGWLILEVVPIDRRFWPRGPWAGRLQKRRDAAAMSGSTLPKGDPSGIALKVTEQM